MHSKCFQTFHLPSVKVKSNDKTVQNMEILFHGEIQNWLCFEMEQNPAFSDVICKTARWGGRDIWLSVSQTYFFLLHVGAHKSYNIKTKQDDQFKNKNWFILFQWHWEGCQAIKEKQKHLFPNKITVKGTQFLEL